MILYISPYLVDKFFPKSYLTLPVAISPLRKMDEKYQILFKIILDSPIFGWKLLVVGNFVDGLNLNGRKVKTGENEWMKLFYLDGKEVVSFLIMQSIRKIYREAQR